FMAPALVALIASTPIRPSSSRRSSTPQTNAPWAPPPWRARFTFFMDRAHFTRSPGPRGWFSTPPAASGYETEGNPGDDRASQAARTCATSSPRVSQCTVAPTLISYNRLYETTPKGARDELRFVSRRARDPFGRPFHQSGDDLCLDLDPGASLSPQGIY